MSARPRLVTGRRNAKPAEPVRAPVASAEMVAARAEDAARLKLVEAEERRRLLRVLIMLAVVVLVASMMRAGWGRVFVHGWWRLW